MTSPLTVFAPRIGCRSETFIRRHVQELEAGCPVITETLDAPDSGHWQGTGPTLVLDRLKLRTFLPARLLPILEWQAILRFLHQQGSRTLLGEYLDSSLRLLPMARRLGMDFWVHAHGYDISQCLRSAFWRERYLEYRQATGIITISTTSRERLIGLGLDPARIHVVPCGVQVPPSLPVRQPGQLVRCLAVGRMVAKKGPLLTLAAFQQARKANESLHLDIVGTGPLEADVRAYVQTHGLEHAVTLHGSQPSHEVHRLMQQSDIFLQHSLTDPHTGDEEGLPVSILEAMANGLPVLATRHAGIPEAVLENETGLLVAEHDVTAMAERLIDLADSFSERMRLGRLGFQRVKARFSWEQERSDLRSLLHLPELGLTASSTIDV